MSIHLTDIDHVGIAVEDLEASVATYRRLLGYSARYWPVAVVASIGMLFDAACGAAFTLVIKPMLDDLFVAKNATTIFWMPLLTTRGPGLHHLAYRVRDLAAALEHVRAEGGRLVDETPRPGSRNTLIAFVHPRSMGGVLVELVQEG